MMLPQFLPAVLLALLLGASAPVGHVASLSFPGCNNSFRMKFRSSVSNEDGIRDVSFEPKLFREPYAGIVTFRSEPIGVQSGADVLDLTSTVLIDFSEPPEGARYSDMVRENGPFGVCQFEVSIRDVETDSVLVHDLIRDAVILKGETPSPIVRHARLNLDRWAGRHIRLEVSGIGLSTYGISTQYSAADQLPEPDGDLLR